MAARTRRFLPWCSRAGRFTRRGLISAPTFASNRAPWRPTLRHTARFAVERHLDRVARAINMTPEEFRRRNFICKGQTTATGQLIQEDVNFNALLDRALRESDYYAKRERFARENPGAAIKRGIGFASFMHGAGFTGSGEVYLASIVELEATPEGC